MTQEDKELLLKDLCARLPYGVKIKYLPDNRLDGIVLPYLHNGLTVLQKGAISYRANIKYIRPYLRPMSSMTEEEWKELNCIGYIVPLYDGCFGVDMRAYCKNGQPYYRRFSDFSTIEDWLNSHHFDYRGLIEKGLALEAAEGMYKI